MTLTTEEERKEPSLLLLFTTQHPKGPIKIYFCLFRLKEETTHNVREGKGQAGGGGGEKSFSFYKLYMLPPMLWIESQSLSEIASTRNESVRLETYFQKREKEGKRPKVVISSDVRYDTSGIVSFQLSFFACQPLLPWTWTKIRELF